MAKIFVSYRRDDASSEAGRITDWLDRHFGEDDVFMDINALGPGVDFVEVIEHEVDTIDALIAVIGPGWVDAQDEHGNRRLDDPTDWVRLEIASALRRGIRVIPVLVRGAVMPPAAKLPEDLQQLRRRNALPITERHFRADVEELIEALDGVVTPSPPPPQPPPEGEQAGSRPLPAYSGWSVLGVVVGSAMVLSGVFVVGSDGTSLLEPYFGGPGNFHDSTVLWRLGCASQALPTLAVAATAIVALLVAQRKERSRAACGGAILLCGVQGVALYACVLSSDERHRPGFLVALAGSLLLGAVSLPMVFRLVGGASEPLLRSTRATAVVGAAMTVVAAVINFNNGGLAQVNAASVFDGRVERWDLLVIAAVAATIGVLAPILRVPRPFLGGALVACGVGAASIWPRFIVVPLIEDRDIASPGAGGFVGIAGAALILVAGYSAVRSSQRQAGPVVTAEVA